MLEEFLRIWDCFTIRGILNCHRIEDDFVSHIINSGLYRKLAFISFGNFSECRMSLSIFISISIIREVKLLNTCLCLYILVDSLIQFKTWFLQTLLCNDFVIELSRYFFYFFIITILVACN